MTEMMQHGENSLGGEKPASLCAMWKAQNTLNMAE